MSSHDRQLMSELDRHPIESIDKFISLAQASAVQNNASHLRSEAILALLKQEKARRAKAKAHGIERDGQGRGP